MQLLLQPPPLQIWQQVSRNELHMMHIEYNAGIGMRIESRCAVCQDGPSCGFVQFESTLGFVLKMKQHVEHFETQKFMF